ncbi:universal stress protein [Microbacterium rhizosphaerae]|uniref:Universal stress protein n=1 Tax=Microbacterium rhizosphaerae TaxID=1678237 RepID=A0ABZ0SHU1_9MICO|nr:universal stress protein [Microbacterium rhizosphaerae]WPR88270.1 universal stress protein [Microbacterium rhizosphaerae]
MEELTDSDRILVGVDGSASSIHALRYAARMAEAFDAPLEAVTTWYYPAFTEFEFATDWSPQQDAADILDQAIAEAFADDPPELTRHVIAGPPSRTLIDLSADSAMLVLGSRGHGGFAGLLLGSVSAACAEHAHCPVLIVHERRAVGASEDTP